MNVAQLLSVLHREARGRAYVRRLDVLDQSPTLLKARLYVSPGLFVQVYRNDRFNMTSLVLIHNGQRIYARDQLDGVWRIAMCPLLLTCTTLALKDAGRWTCPSSWTRLKPC